MTQPSVIDWHELTRAVVSSRNRALRAQLRKIAEQDGITMVDLIGLTLNALVKSRGFEPEPFRPTGFSGLITAESKNESEAREAVPQ